MPTVEDYFDDDTDLPLPSSSKPRALPNTGHKGALLEEIDDEADIDFELLAEQGRTVFGEGSKGAPPLSAADKGKMSMRQDPGEIRPTGPAGGGGPRIDPNTPMGGFMGDMLKMQQAEDERMEKLRKQFGGASVQDPGMYKA
jgi:signal recognition particle subunit SRP19